MKWMLMQQIPDDFIKYMLSETNSTQYLSYNDFLKYISSFVIKDYVRFKKELNTFRTIILYLDTGEWEVKKLEKDKDVKFSVLHDLNEEKEKELSKVEKSNLFFDRVTKNSKKLIKDLTG